MPRSVRVAVATSCVMALLGVASIAVWVGDLFSGDSVSVALGLRGVRSLLSPLYATAFAVPLAAGRRDERVRELAFQFSLLAALLLGFMVLFALAAAILGAGAAPFAATLFVFGLTAVLAWSLSTPSAKVGFREHPSSPR